MLWHLDKGKGLGILLHCLVKDDAIHGAAKVNVDLSLQNLHVVVNVAEKKKEEIMPTEHTYIHIIHINRNNTGGKGGGAKEL